MIACRGAGVVHKESKHQQMKRSVSENDPALEDSLRSVLAAFPTTARYLVGVSGGRDSVCLLYLLHGLGYRRLVVCHLNHGLRGRAATADARFVEQLAGKLGFEFESDRCDVARKARELKVSIEAAGRAARYEFFGTVARRRRCVTLLLAHHADDQVETFLFNLFRGAGAAGLGGMRAVSEREGLRIVRPLLGVWRAQIDRFIQANKIRFREDATNAGCEHSRNRMRNQIIPFLEKAFGRQIREALQRTAEILGAESRWIEAQTPEAADELDVKQLRKTNVALQRRLVRNWLRQRGVPNVGYREVESVRGLLEAEAAAKINLPGGLFARRRAGKLFIQ